MRPRFLLALPLLFVLACTRPAPPSPITADAIPEPTMPAIALATVAMARRKRR